MASKMGSDQASLTERTTLQTFELFQKLPYELRLKIWHYCMPGMKVQEIDLPCATEIFNYFLDESRIPCCTLDRTSFIHASAPLMSTICYESRAECSKNRVPNEYWRSNQQTPKLARWYQRPFRTVPWTSTGDMPHLNRTRKNRDDWYGGSKRDASPLHILAWRAEKLSSPVASFMIDFLSWDESVHEAISDRRKLKDPLPWSDSFEQAAQELDAFPRLHHWLVVMRVVVVHARAEETGDLFGPQADNRIQILDYLEDTDKIEKLFALARQSQARNRGMRVPQALRQGTQQEVQERLETILLRRYRGQHPGTTIRSAIMFRLCTTTMCSPVPPAPWLEYKS